MSKTERDITADALPRNGQWGGSSFFGKNPLGLEAAERMALPATFPNGARAAALMTFDCEGTYGNGAGDMAVEVKNYFRMCERLEKLGLKATFNVVGLMAEEQGPDFVRRMYASGSEVASHCYWHDMFSFGEYPYHGHYGFAENLESLKRSKETLEKIIGAEVRGARIPYGHFNEHTYDAIEAAGYVWASNVARECILAPSQGYGPVPFMPTLGGKKYDFVEIPIDADTYDWAIWMADENNEAFVERVRMYTKQRGIALERTPSGAARVWAERIRETVEKQSVFTLLCHPTNLAVASDRWDDPVEEFLFPVFDELARRQDAGELWVATCGEMAEFYHGNGGE